jgi:NADH-quinone oxidoreductase subunit J
MNVGYPLASVIPPAMILVLCVVAGIATVLMLPSRFEPSVRKIGGVIMIAVGLILAAMLVRGAQGAGINAYFWVFSAIAIVSALRVVTHPRPVYSALYFILTVFASAGLFVLLWAEFMAAALVLIYAGAILVTYVFVIMLASQSGPADADENAPGKVGTVAEYDAISREPIIASAAGFALMAILLFVIFDKGQGLAQNAAATRSEGTTQALGYYLFQHQLVNLELAGLLLTVAMIGAIVIARRRVSTGQETPVEDVLTAAATPVDDNPHSVPVYGTENPRQKAFPET